MKRYSLYSVTEPNGDYSGYNVHYWIEVDGIYYGKMWSITSRRIAQVLDMIEKREIHGLIGIPYSSSKIDHVK